MSLERLKEQFGGAWPTLEKARETAREQVRKLDELLTEEGRSSGSLVSADVSLVVFGSLARGEWTSGSDLDWTLLIDGGADHEHANTAHRIGELLRDRGFSPP